jgi:hypothetical protein
MIAVPRGTSRICRTGGIAKYSEGLKRPQNKGLPNTSALDHPFETIQWRPSRRWVGSGGGCDLSAVPPSVCTGLPSDCCRFASRCYGNPDNESSPVVVIHNSSAGRLRMAGTGQFDLRQCSLGSLLIVLAANPLPPGRQKTTSASCYPAACRTSSRSASNPRPNRGLAIASCGVYLSRTSFEREI